MICIHGKATRRELWCQIRDDDVLGEALAVSEEECGRLCSALVHCLGFAHEVCLIQPF